MRRARIAVLFVPLIVLAARPLLAAEPRAGTMLGDLRELAALRNELAAKLQGRIEADAAVGTPRDLFLVLPEGADREETRMVLRQRGGEWLTSYAVVPYWRQQTLKEKFSFLHRSGVLSTDRDEILNPLDASGLRIEDGRLAGQLDATYYIDWLREERMKPGGRHMMTVDGRWSLMDKWRIVDHQQPRKQLFEVDAKVLDNIHRFDLVFADAIDGKPADLSFLISADPWAESEVVAPTWNASIHELDVSGLSYSDGRLSGLVKVRWVPDPWWPKKVHYVTCEVDARADGRVVTGGFEARVTRTEDIKVTGQSKGRRTRKGPSEWEGTITGRVLQAVEGDYTARGDLGTYSGRVLGGMDTPQPEVREILEDVPVAGDDASEIAARAAKLYAQVRALRLATMRYPYPLRRALARTCLPAPQWPEDADSAAAAAWLKRTVAAAKADATPIEPATSDDPLFGPYYGAAPLKGETDTAGRFVLPPRSTGPQRWQFVPTWHVLGPLPQARDVHPKPVGTPDVVPAPGADHEVDPESLERAVLPAEAMVGWAAVEADGPKLTAPAWTADKRGARPGLAGSVWYATAELVADENREVWLGLATLDQGVLWVNDRLVWTSEEREWGHHQVETDVVKISLKKGVNRLLLRCRDDRGGSWFSLAVCTRGGPSSPAKELQPPTPPRGERKVRGTPGEWAHWYPKATPPLAWDLEKGINVKWRKSVALPSFRPASTVSATGMTVSIPARTPPLIVVGNRLLVAERPNRLLCLDPLTGKETWRREVSVVAVIAEDRLSEYEKADPEGRLKILREFGVADKKTRPGDLRPSPPASDGERVILPCNTGVAACYGLDGERRWIVRTDLEKARAFFAGDRVVLEGTPLEAWPETFDVEMEKPGKRGPHGILILDAASGKVLRAIPADGFFHNPGRLMHLARGDHRMALFITREGELVDVGRGEKLDRRFDPGTDWHWSGVHQAGEVLVSTFVGGRAAARFWLDADGQLGYRMLWRGNRLHAFVTGGPGSAVGDDELIYTTRLAPEHAKHCPASVVSLDIFERADGDHVDWINPVLRGGNTHMQPVLAGGYLYVPDGRGAPHTGGPPEDRQIVVVKAGREPYVVARNRAPHVRATPVADGNRLLLCLGGEIVCVEVSEETGRAYQDEQVAKSLFAEMFDESVTAPMRSISPPGDTPWGEVPLVPLRPDQAIAKWLVAGPFPPHELDAAPAGLGTKGGPDAAVGATIEVGDTRRKLLPLPTEWISSETSFRNDGRLDDWQLRSTRRKIDLAPMTEDVKGGVVYLFAVLRNARDRVIISTMRSPLMELWIAGQRVKMGEPVHLAMGYYPVLVRVQPDVAGRSDVQMPVDVAKALEAGALKEIDWPTRWKVFGPVPEAAGLLPKNELATVPDKVTLGDRTFEPATLTADGPTLDLMPLLDEGAAIPQTATAYAFTTVDLPADGRLIVNAAADWFMAWYVDGTLVYDTLKTGNMKNPVQVTAHTFGVDLKKGKHVLAVRVKPGSKGWSLTSRAALETDRVADLHKKYPAKGGVQASKPDTRIAPTLREAVYPQRVYEVWLEQIKVRRDRLEWVLREMPGTEYAERAETYLDELRKHRARQ